VTHAERSLKFGVSIYIDQSESRELDSDGHSVIVSESKMSKLIISVSLLLPKWAFLQGPQFCSGLPVEFGDKPAEFGRGDMEDGGISPSSKQTQTSSSNLEKLQTEDSDHDHDDAAENSDHDHDEATENSDRDHDDAAEKSATVTGTTGRRLSRENEKAKAKSGDEDAKAESAAMKPHDEETNTMTRQSSDEETITETRQSSDEETITETRRLSATRNWPGQAPPRRELSGWTTASKSDWTPTSKSGWTTASKSDWTTASKSDWTPTSKSGWTTASKSDWTTASKSGRTPTSKSGWTMASESDWTTARKSDWTTARKSDWTTASKSDWTTASKSGWTPTSKSGSTMNPKSSPMTHRRFSEKFSSNSPTNKPRNSLANKPKPSNFPTNKPSNSPANKPEPSNANSPTNKPSDSPANKPSKSWSWPGLEYLMGIAMTTPGSFITSTEINSDSEKDQNKNQNNDTLSRDTLSQDTLQTKNASEEEEEESVNEVDTPVDTQKVDAKELLLGFLRSAATCKSSGGVKQIHHGEKNMDTTPGYVFTGYNCSVLWKGLSEDSKDESKEEEKTVTLEVEVEVFGGKGDDRITHRVTFRELHNDNENENENDNDTDRNLPVDRDLIIDHRKNVGTAGPQSQDYDMISKKKTQQDQRFTTHQKRLKKLHLSRSFIIDTALSASLASRFPNSGSALLFPIIDADKIWSSNWSPPPNSENTVYRYESSSRISYESDRSSSRSSRSLTQTQSSTTQTQSNTGYMTRQSNTGYMTRQSSNTGSYMFIPYVPKPLTPENKWPPLTILEYLMKIEESSIIRTKNGLSSEKKVANFYHDKILKKKCNFVRISESSPPDSSPDSDDPDSSPDELTTIPIPAWTQKIEVVFNDCEADVDEKRDVDETREKLDDSVHEKRDTPMTKSLTLEITMLQFGYFMSSPDHITASVIPADHSHTTSNNLDHTTASVIPADHNHTISKNLDHTTASVIPADHNTTSKNLDHATTSVIPADHNHTTSNNLDHTTASVIPADHNHTISKNLDHITASVIPADHNHTISKNLDHTTTSVIPADHNHTISKNLDHITASVIPADQNHTTSKNHIPADHNHSSDHIHSSGHPSDHIHSYPGAPHASGFYSGLSSNSTPYFSSKNHLNNTSNLHSSALNDDAPYRNLPNNTPNIHNSAPLSDTPTIHSSSAPLSDTPNFHSNALATLSPHSTYLHDSILITEQLFERDTGTQINVGSNVDTPLYIGGGTQIDDNISPHIKYTATLEKNPQPRSREILKDNVLKKNPRLSVLKKNPTFVLKKNTRLVLFSSRICTQMDSISAVLSLFSQSSDSMGLFEVSRENI